MSETIFILGAGASAHCGTPLMYNFLKEAKKLRPSVRRADDPFVRVFEAINKLNAVHSKGKLDTDNIEDVYSAFEMGQLIGRLPGITDIKQINGLTSDIKKVIGYTLENSTKLKGTYCFDAYIALVNIIVCLIERIPQSFSVITFNYDLGLDHTFYQNPNISLTPDYGLDDLTVKDKYLVTYLKLHGSINFGKCSNQSCAKIKPYRKLKYEDTFHILRSDDRVFRIMSDLQSQKCPVCNQPWEDNPVIIPPTWEKTTRHMQIAPIWRKAAEELQDARRIFIIGYSLPETDWFFNYFFGLSIDLETDLEGLYIYDVNPKVEERFKNMLGPGLSKRLYFYPKRFEDAVHFDLGSGIRTIPQVLGIKPDWLPNFEKYHKA